MLGGATTQVRAADCRPEGADAGNDARCGCVRGELSPIAEVLRFHGDTCEQMSSLSSPCGGTLSDTLVRDAQPNETLDFVVESAEMQPVLSVRESCDAATELGCSANAGRTIVEVETGANESLIVSVGSVGECGPYELMVIRHRCGNGRTETGEQCDDGNQSDDDGCSAICEIESADCGDDTQQDDEGCDDGADNSNTAADACRTHCQPPRCGDWVVDSDEECDDGNDFSGDGCDGCVRDGPWCPRAEDPAFPWSGTTETSGDDARGSCGGSGGRDVAVTWSAPRDAFYSFTASSDAFSVVLSIRLGGCDGVELACAAAAQGETSIASVVDWPLQAGDELAIVVDTGAGSDIRYGHPFTLDLTSRYCGDGVLDDDLGEECDTGAADADPRCTADCLVQDLCGNGAVDPGEDCDDGDDNSDTARDACRENCLAAHCGDDVVDSGEACDDGPRNSDEVPGACRKTCVLPSCGDGVVDPGEACDDGNTSDGDTCPGDCQLPPGICGDGVRHGGEDCDDGGDNSDTAADACRTDCTQARCGDGVTDTGELCDEAEANAEAPDACRPDCTPPRCGDDVTDSGEECDDGGTTVGDGCDARCRLEPPSSCGDGSSVLRRSCASRRAASWRRCGSIVGKAGGSTACSPCGPARWRRPGGERDSPRRSVGSSSSKPTACRGG